LRSRRALRGGDDEYSGSLCSLVDTVLKEGENALVVVILSRHVAVSNSKLSHAILLLGCCVFVRSEIKYLKKMGLAIGKKTDRILYPHKPSHSFRRVTRASVILRVSLNDVIPNRQWLPHGT